MALALIGAAALLGLVMSIPSVAWPYALAIVWALAGIVAANRAHTTVAGTAGVGVLPLVLAIAVSPVAA